MTGPVPFKLRIADESIRDLQLRLQSVRFIDDLEHCDWESGPPPAFVRSLCGYWLNHFDWRRFEQRINREPQVTLETDGLRLHAIHRRSSRSGAIPLLLIHGWPGAFTEYLELCQPLSEPGPDHLPFHVVVPSLPGFGFSTTRHGVAVREIASVFATLMERLGYDRFMVQGGNWGGIVGTEMARQFPEKVSALHLSSISGSPPEDRTGLEISGEEQSWVVDPATFPHFALLTRKPAMP